MSTFLSHPFLYFYDESDCPESQSEILVDLSASSVVSACVSFEGARRLCKWVEFVEIAEGCLIEAGRCSVSVLYKGALVDVVLQLIDISQRIAIWGAAKGFELRVHLQP
jgi:hypothetical protein